MDYYHKYNMLLGFVNMISHGALTIEQHDIVDRILNRSGESRKFLQNATEYFLAEVECQRKDCLVLDETHFKIASEYPATEDDVFEKRKEEAD